MGDELQAATVPHAAMGVLAHRIASSTPLGGRRSGVGVEASRAESRQLEDGASERSAWQDEMTSAREGDHAGVALAAARVAGGIDVTSEPSPVGTALRGACRTEAGNEHDVVIAIVVVVCCGESPDVMEAIAEESVALGAGHRDGRIVRVDELAATITLSEAHDAVGAGPRAAFECDDVELAIRIEVDDVGSAMDGAGAAGHSPRLVADRPAR